MNISNEQFSNQIWTAPKAITRFLQVCTQLVIQPAVSLLRHIPGLGRIVDRPAMRPLRSSNFAMLRWARAPYGTQSKPASLAEIPWDYVKENEAKIPFVGLREYWYPAIRSTELPNNKPVPVTMLGDNVVFFRDAKGTARAMENRCPHRGALLSLGQVGVYAPGTITCRYHGMTFDGDGNCVAVLTEGPNSRACGRITAKTYPVAEAGGVVWIYMGEKAPGSLMNSVPHIREALNVSDTLMAMRDEWPVNYLATLDNDTDLAHPSCVHRTCLPFMSQKMWGEIGVEEQDDGGIRSFFKDTQAHRGQLMVESTLWYLPNIAYFGPGMIGYQPRDHSFVWAVPRDIGNTAYWILLATPMPRLPVVRSIVRHAARLSAGLYYPWPGSPASCVEGADASMIQSQGRVARWDKDRLLSMDAATARARLKLKQAYQAELAERRTG